MHTSGRDISDLSTGCNYRNRYSERDLRGIEGDPTTVNLVPNIGTPWNFNLHPRSGDRCPTNHQFLIVRSVERLFLPVSAEETESISNLDLCIGRLPKEGCSARIPEPLKRPPVAFFNMSCLEHRYHRRRLRWSRTLPRRSLARPLAPLPRRRAPVC